jgi:hypothetical protein
MKKPIAYAVLLLALAEFGILLIVTSSAPDDTKFSADPLPFENTAPYSFQTIDGGAVLASFPKAAYLTARTFENVFNLPNEIEQIIQPALANDVQAEDTLFHVLTIDLFNTDSVNYQLSDPNQFLHRIQWAEKMKTLSLSGHKRAVFFQLVYSYWFQKLADQLQLIARTQDDVKFNTDFNYLAHRLTENKYPVSYEISDTEKVLMNMHQGKFGYLWMKLTNKSILFQITIFGLAFINVILVIIAIRSIISKKQTV